MTTASATVDLEKLQHLATKNFEELGALPRPGDGIILGRSLAGDATILRWYEPDERGPEWDGATIKKIIFDNQGMRFIAGNQNTLRDISNEKSGIENNPLSTIFSHIKHLKDSRETARIVGSYRKFNIDVRSRQAFELLVARKSKVGDDTEHISRVWNDIPPGFGYGLFTEDDSPEALGVSPRLFPLPGENDDQLCQIYHKILFRGYSIGDSTRTGVHIVVETIPAVGNARPLWFSGPKD